MFQGPKETKRQDDQLANIDEDPPEDPPEKTPTTSESRGHVQRLFSSGRKMFQGKGPKETKGQDHQLSNMDEVQQHGDDSMTENNKVPPNDDDGDKTDEPQDGNVNKNEPVTSDPKDDRDPEGNIPFDLD